MYVCVYVDWIKVIRVLAFQIRSKCWGKKSQVVSVNPAFHTLETHMHADSEQHIHTHIPPHGENATEICLTCTCVFSTLTWQYDINIKLFLKDAVTEGFRRVFSHRKKNECSNTDCLVCLSCLSVMRGPV